MFFPAQVAATSTAVPLLDVMGRTKLLIISSSICIFSMLGAGAMLVWGENTDSANLIFAKRVAVVFVALFIIGFSMGLGPVVWILAAEFVPLRGFGASMALACAFNWGCSLLVTIFFDFARDTFKLSGMGLFYSVVTFLGCVLVKRLMPETMGRTLEEILLRRMYVGEDSSQSNTPKRIGLSGRAGILRRPFRRSKRSTPRSLPSSAQHSRHHI